jgi:hypothetical protein
VRGSSLVASFTIVVQRGDYGPLDLWAERLQRREATGDMIIVRYADDFIVGCQHESGARPFIDAMREGIG